MSQLKRRATIENVEQIEQETYPREQVRIEEKHEQQFYHEVMGFIDQYLQSKGHGGHGVDALKETDTPVESEASELMQKQSLLRIWSPYGLARDYLSHSAGLLDYLEGLSPTLDLKPSIDSKSKHYGRWSRRHWSRYSWVAHTGNPWNNEPILANTRNFDVQIPSRHLDIWVVVIIGNGKVCFIRND